MRHQVFCSLLLVTTLAGLNSVTRAAPSQPNLVMILADDLGYGDPGCYGGKMVSTPNIDRLAVEGVRCTDGYVTAPICAPSRCGLMTGAYNQRFGIQWNDDRPKYSVGAHQLLPQALHAAGYLTAHIGKWNIGAPIKGCFDEVQDLIDWEADYFPDAHGHYTGVDSPEEHASSKVHGVWGPERAGDEYLTDRMGRHAVEFIEKHRNGPQPFFLYLAFNAVHSPFHAKKEMASRFAKVQPEPLRYYAAMLASLDENIGRVLAVLPENTLVVFASDNGPSKSDLQEFPESWPKGTFLFGSAGPLSGHKGQFLEGGIREPFILRWPGQLKAGIVYGQPVSTMDIYPTLCAAAGAAVPEGTKVDGVNLLPYLRGENSAAPHEVLFWKNGVMGAVREKNWKLVINNNPPRLQLFDVVADMGEQQDRAAANPELVKRLLQNWQTWDGTLPPRANPAGPMRKKGKQK